MKILKTIIIYLVNVLIGYVSAIYLLLAVSGGIQEEEDMRWFGVVMLIVWLFPVWLINVGLGKLLRENMREKLQIFHEKKILWKNVVYTYLSITICIMIGVALRVYVLAPEWFKETILNNFSLSALISYLI